MPNKKPTIILNVKEARSLTLKVWKYLYKHPDVRSKSALPSELRDKIVHLLGECPLCHYFRQACELCPLTKAGEGCFHTNSAWSVWANSEDLEVSNEAVARAARRIYAATKAWKVKVIK